MRTFLLVEMIQLLPSFWDLEIFEGVPLKNIAKKCILL